MQQYGILIVCMFICAIKTGYSQLASGDSDIFPVVVNLATNAEITANATCGEDGREVYCKLVEHVRSKLKVQCGVCDSSSYEWSDRHPVTNILDGSNRWWQSPSIANGKQYNWVTINIDLKQVYLVAYLIIKAANSPRPGNWILEKSVDGENYQPWQYFAITDSECFNTYGIKPTIGHPQYQSDNQVICTSFYSKLHPLENGEIHVSLVNGRPGVEGPSDTLTDFIRARFIRLRFQRIRTLNADLMTFVYNDPKDLDASVANRYFYTIKDISIGGQCICNGYGKFCDLDPETRELMCHCEGETCGSRCDKCCPLFNQQLWKANSSSEAFVCEACNCFGHADECVYNATVADLQLSLNNEGKYEGGGMCVGCKHHTMGINCELCEDGYFRPSQYDPRHPDSCLPCDCDSVGSTGLCIKDDARSFENVYAGHCICKEGYCGPRCDQCEPGYRGYPNCEPCPCNPAGSLSLDNCEYQCFCKRFVCGDNCDECRKGFYDLQESNPEGCTPCFCSGITNQCTSSTWRSQQIATLHGWVVTDLFGSGSVDPQVSRDGVMSVQTIQTRTLNRALYWSAPEPFLGNKMASYGGSLQYAFTYSINSSFLHQDSYLANYDVVMQGNGMRIGHSGQYHPEDIIGHVELNMTETGWHHLEGSTDVTRAPVSKRDFMSLLANVERLLLRSSYNIYQIETKLLYATLEEATERGTGRVMSSVEICVCPPGYAGTSCERCAEGYKRVGHHCMPCECHGHATTCDDITGECLNCQDNTKGKFCEECASGFHGDVNSPRGCQPCACPSPTNNFAEGCVKTPGSRQEYMCIGCQEGHTGNFCEACKEGYYGNPLTTGRPCQPCDCNGNTAPGREGACDRITGECTNCIGHTEGRHCEWCKQGYYGTARNMDCRECRCNLHGSASLSCDRVTGQCRCKPLYTGRDCGQCQPGYGNIAEGCLPCVCGRSSVCDPVTGECRCKPGVGNERCTECLPDHYGMTVDGCKRCECDPQKSLGSQCDSVTGQCECKPLVTGRTCDQCQTGYWSSRPFDGCKECSCNTVGSVSDLCDTDTGNCQCKPGVTGRDCDTCEDGYYGFSQQGCLECDPCITPGHICHPQTGKCVCPPHTQGKWCDSCEPNTWGYDPVLGCKPCGCSTDGSISLQCGAGDGKCTCRSRFHGIHCDQCQEGHYDFPKCEPCYCNAIGTLPGKCDSFGDCECGPTGQCPCKENVEGKKCSACIPGSFSLRTDNPKGCTDCFCFGRSDECSQAQYTWSQIFFPEQRVNIVAGHENRIKPIYNHFLVVPPGVSPVSVEPAEADNPMYWELPEKVLGDRTLSYNGKLRFKLSSKGQKPSVRDQPKSPHPLVYLVGNYVLRLHYTDPLESDPSSYHQITFREDLWTDDNGNSVSREVFMIALQKVQTLLIKAADNAHVETLRLYGASLDHAVPSNGSFADAFGIERCVCPPAYTSLSCQDPNNFYYRKINVNLREIGDPLDLVGESVPCECYHHAYTCDKETGVCETCQHNTTGANCEKCAHGFYGVATTGTPQDCKPCACPLTNPDNNPTCVAVPGGDYECQDCVEGYDGPKCDKCAPGYYGNPKIVGEKCRPCACNTKGSIGEDCDQLTGECICLPGLYGPKCDQCGPNYALVEGTCQSCLEGCTGKLLTEIAHINQTLDRVDPSKFIVLPWDRLNEIGKRTAKLRKLWSSTDVRGLRQIQDEIASAIDLTSDLAEQAEDLLNDLKKMAKLANTAKLESDNLLTTIDTIATMIKKHVTELIVLTECGIWGHATDVTDLKSALERIKQSLEEILNVNFDDSLKKAENELRLAQKLLERVKGLYGNGSVEVTPNPENLDAVISKLENLQELAINAFNVSEEALAKKDQGRLHFEEVSKLVAELNAKNGKEDKTLREARQINRDANRILDSSSDPVKYEARDYEDDSVLEEWLNRMEVACILAGPTQKLTSLVDRARNHSFKLYIQAEELDNMMAGTRKLAANPMKAAKVYENIKTAVDEADAAVSKVAGEVRAATDKMTDVADRTKRVMDHSSHLINTATRLKNDAIDLKSNLDLAKVKAGLCGDDSASARDHLDDINRALDNMTFGLLHPVRAIKYRSETSKNKTDAIGEDADKKLKHIRDVIKPHIRIAKNYKPEKIENTAIHVNNAVRKSSELVNLTNFLFDKMQTIDQLGNTIGLNLRLLRERIRQARALAGSMQVSLHHDGDCVRSYEPEFEASTSNAITLHFKTGQADQPMQLFLVNDQSTKEYMALELKDSKVSFTWNVGGGRSTIQHDLVVESTTSDDEEKANWYKVEARRYSNLGKLRVMKIGSDDPVSDKIDIGPDGYTRMDIGNQTMVYAGGVPPTYKLPEGVTTRTFEGCMDAVYLDGKRIGMYDFRNLNGTSCGGCSTVRSLSIGTGVFQFDGSGYAIVPQVIYRRDKFTIILQFRSYWENALLFFTANEDTRDFVSLELKDGKVVFQFSFLGEALVSIETDRKYNTNEWISVTAKKNKRQGRLEVEREVITYTGKDTRFEVQDLKTSLLYFAGVPTNIDSPRYGVTNVAFLGCLRNIEIGSRGTFRQNLDTGLFAGMGIGCKASILRTVGFEGEGHLELESVELGVDASIAFSFHTTEKNALLLLAKGTDSETKGSIAHLLTKLTSPKYSIDTLVETLHSVISQFQTPNSFYSFSLSDGKVIVLINGGAGAATLSSSKTYNDGKIHSVAITKSNRMLTLYMDDKSVDSTRMPSGAVTVGNMRGERGGLYIGGVPEEVDASGMASSLEPLKGCVQDLVINGRLMTLDAPVNYSRADVGRCDIERLSPELVGPSWTLFTVHVTKPVSLQDTTTTTTTTIAPSTTRVPPTSCARERRDIYEDDAAAFGDLRHSHSEIMVRRRDIKRDFNISLEFRTYFGRGLIFYIANEAQTEYVAVQLRDAQVVLSYDDKGLSREIESGSNLDDGEWHSLNVTKEKKVITIQIDDNKPTVNSMTRKIDVIAPIYVGGLPEIYEPRFGLISESMRGCMRNFYLNNQHENVANSKAIMGVRQCEQTVEPGAHFDGFGYALLDQEYEITGKFDVSVDFRTTKPNGVILSISDPYGEPALAVEMYNGQVRITVVTEDGKFYAESEECEHCLCDNNWHSIQAEYIKNVVTLVVDDSNQKVGVSPGYINFLGTHDELYVGGYPYYAQPQEGTNTDEFFNGCLRNLSINGTDVDWHEAYQLVDVHVSACPHYPNY